MAAPVKDGKIWRHRLMVKGIRVSGTFETKAAALAWEADQRVQLANGKAKVVEETCKDAFDRYEREVSRHKAGKRFEVNRLAAMGAMSLGAVKISEVDETHIAAWRDERLRTVSGATVNREMNLLSHVFSVARKEWKWLSKSPTTDVARPKAKPPRDRLISEDEITAICLALGWDQKAPDMVPTTKQHRIALAFLFAIETAMRAGEICGLGKADVSGRVARLKMTKNGFARDVALSPRAQEIWSMVPDGFDISSASLDALFRKARKRSGVEGLTFHDTRHEAITRLAGKLGVLDLARMVGHRDIRQLQTYYNATADDIAAKL